jgi:hypothetical protein
MRTPVLLGGCLLPPVVVEIVGRWTAFVAAIGSTSDDDDDVGKNLSLALCANSQSYRLKMLSAGQLEIWHDGYCVQSKITGSFENNQTPTL